MSYNVTKIQRRPWTEEEKKSALMSCSSKCARCGKKLNMKSLTMEHVVPISKGGENVLDNLIVLCKPCNSRKGSKFCWPQGYYMALTNSSKMNAIGRYTFNWVLENITEDNIMEFPLFTEHLSVQLDTNAPIGNKFVPQFTKDIVELNSDSIKRYMTALDFTEEDLMNTVPKKDQLFSVFGLQSYDGSSVYSVFTVQYENKAVILSEIKSTNKLMSSIIPMGVLNSLMRSYQEFGILKVLIRTQNINTIDFIVSSFQTHVAKVKVTGRYYIGSSIQSINLTPWFDENNQFMFVTNSLSDEAIESAKDNLRKSKILVDCFL